MPKRETIADALAPTQYALARILQDVLEDGRLTPPQFRMLAAALAGYVPAHVTLEQRSPKGVTYATIRTEDDTFLLTVNHRAHLHYG